MARGIAPGHVRSSGCDRAVGERANTSLAPPSARSGHHRCGCFPCRLQCVAGGCLFPPRTGHDRSGQCAALRSGGHTAMEFASTSYQQRALRRFNRRCARAGHHEPAWRETAIARGHHGREQPFVRGPYQYGEGTGTSAAPLPLQPGCSREHARPARGRGELLERTYGEHCGHHVLVREHRTAFGCFIGVEDGDVDRCCGGASGDGLPACACWSAFPHGRVDRIRRGCLGGYRGPLLSPLRQRNQRELR